LESPLALVNAVKVGGCCRFSLQSRPVFRGFVGEGSPLPVEASYHQRKEDLERCSTTSSWIFRGKKKTRLARGPLVRDGRLDRVMPRLPVLAEPPHSFTQTHRQGGDGFQALLPSVRQLAIVLPPHFR
jgi:hypothetical protein